MDLKSAKEYAAELQSEKGFLKVHVNATVELPGVELPVVRTKIHSFTAEDAERIFAPFVQGHRPPPVERQGSGVGLSIVRELISVMDGKIQLLSADSAGAHFEIALPWIPAR